MAFTNSISLNFSQPTSITYQDIWNDGRVGSTWLVPVTRSLIDERTASYNKTKGFKPGVFSVNPIELRQSLSTDVKCPSVLLPKNYPSGGTRISGSLASAMRVNGSGASLTGYLPNLDYLDLNRRNRVLANAYAKITEADMDFGMFFAEGAETLRMLRNPLQGVRALTLKLQRKLQGKGHRPVRTSLNDLTNQWMEYRYGITPLVKDAQAMLKLHEKGLRKFQQNISKTFYREIQDSQVVGYKTGFYWNSNYMAGWNWESRLIRKQTAICRCFFIRRCRGNDILFTLGLNPVAIGALVWELIPYSFVVDWFVGVGDWIKALQPKPGIDILGNTIALKTEWINPIQTTMGQSYFDRPWVPTPSSSVLTQRAFTRETNLPLPAYPAVQADFLNYKRSLDSISMIWQNMPQLIKRLT